MIQVTSLPKLGASEGTVRVVYIAGSGRSGSTVLDTILGNHPEVFSVGELCNVHRAAWTNGEFCACGKRGNECNFWTRVLEAWKRRVPDASVENYIKLQHEFERFRRWPRFVREMLWPSNRFANYRRQTYSLYAAVSEASGRSIIVDSSKLALRAALLSRIPEIDLKLVHLVRDVRGVAWSKCKPYARDDRLGIQREMSGRPAWKSAMHWVVANCCCGWVRALPKVDGIRVHYEDLVSHPEQTLTRIGELIGVDTANLARAAAAGESMHIGHTIAGNRLRMGGAVKLRSDSEWMHRLPASDRRRCWLIAGWLLSFYGYRRRGELRGQSSRQPTLRPAA